MRDIKKEIKDLREQVKNLREEKLEMIEKQEYFHAAEIREAEKIIIDSIRDLQLEYAKNNSEGKIFNRDIAEFRMGLIDELCRKGISKEEKKIKEELLVNYSMHFMSRGYYID